MAIAGATGISRGSAFTIWSLLFDEGDDGALTSLARPRFRRFTTVAGEKCHRITATDRMGRRIDIYVGMADLIVRGWVSRSGRFPHAEIRTNIAVDVTFSDVDFSIADGVQPQSS
jgi:hypothetical protein